MLAIGHYRLVLHPDAEPAQFEELLTGELAFALQLTRITTSVTHQLLRVSAPRPQSQPTREYIFQVSVQLMASDMRYDFEDNLERLQTTIKHLATVLGVEAAVPVDAPPG